MCDCGLKIGGEFVEDLGIRNLDYLGGKIILDEDKSKMVVLLVKDREGNVIGGHAQKSSIPKSIEIGKSYLNRNYLN